MYTKGPSRRRPRRHDGDVSEHAGRRQLERMSYDPALGLVFTNVMNLGQVARMSEGKADRRPTTWCARRHGAARSAASGIPRTRFRARRRPSANSSRSTSTRATSPGRCRSASSRARRRKASTTPARQHRRPHRDRQRPAVRRRHDRQPLSRVRVGTGKQLWETELDACAHAADDLHGQGPPPIRRRRRRRRQLSWLAPRTSSSRLRAAGRDRSSPRSGSHELLAVSRALGRNVFCSPVRASRPGRAPRSTCSPGPTSIRLSARVITHALATIERLGYESGAYDTISGPTRNRSPSTAITFKTGTGIATGEQFLATT